MGVRGMASIVAVAALAATACGGEPGAEPDAESGRAALAAMTATLQDAVVRKDPTAIYELFAEDAVVHGPDGSVLTGKDAIAGVVAALLPRVTSYSLASQRSESSGDLAYDAQTFQLGLTDADSTRALTGHHLLVARRDASGAWKIVRSGSWHGRPPAPHQH